MLTLSEQFYYDPKSPSFLRRNCDWISGKSYKIIRAHKGDVAGWIKKDRCEYYMVKLNGRDTPVHRIVWQLHNGKIPRGYQVDHKDGNSLNNDINNLRCVKNVTNARNQKFRSTNTSKVCGVGLLINKKKSGENRYWKAQWNNLEGKRSAKCFSVVQYGEQGAFELACQYRDKMIKELNANGAGYSDRHGT